MGQGESGNNVKKYYRDVERYDWVAVTDKFRGVESIFHFNRMRVMIRLFRGYNVGSPILDVGCGTGLILRKLPPSSIGLDVNPWAIDKARIHAPDSEFIIGDAERLPLRLSSIHTVICTEVLEHVPDPVSVLTNIHDILIMNGRLIGSVPHNTLLWKFRILSSTCPHAEPFHNQYHPDEIKILLQKFKKIVFRLSTLRLNIVFVTQKLERDA